METNIVICQGSSCFSRGNKENLAIIQKYISDNNLEANISFKGQLCTNNCKESPIFILNEITHIQVDAKKTLEILEAHFKG